LFIDIKTHTLIHAGTGTQHVLPLLRTPDLLVGRHKAGWRGVIFLYLVIGVEVLVICVDKDVGFVAKLENSFRLGETSLLPLTLRQARPALLVVLFVTQKVVATALNAVVTLNHLLSFGLATRIVRLLHFAEFISNAQD